MRRLLIGYIAALLLPLAYSIAYADTHTFATAGTWSAFGGTADDGTRVCGISSSDRTGRYFGLKFYDGDDSFTIQIGSPGWTISNGADQALAMQIDNNTRWNATATGMHFNDGDAGLTFDIDRNAIQQFIGQFRSGSTLRIAFPGTNVDAWAIGLSGTNAVVSSLQDCLRIMGN